MFCVTIAYPKQDDGKFDFDYYSTKHLPMAAGHLGDNVTKAEVRRGLVAADGSTAPFVCITNLWINSVEDFQAALTNHGGEILGDLPNFTNCQPVIQISEVLG